MAAATQSSRVLRLPDVVQKTGLKRDTVYRKIREGSFPKPLKLSERASGWLEVEVDLWIATLAAKRSGV
ncbi:MAG: AlpA family transcriptional regulator [Gammaproteobacteria bacterium]|nr:AlpA family transcriptional regulator [Gammaproteobacteria bacterium]